MIVVRKSIEIVIRDLEDMKGSEDKKSAPAFQPQT